MSYKTTFKRNKLKIMLDKLIADKHKIIYYKYK
jgi:hypothetical protein